MPASVAHGSLNIAVRQAKVFSYRECSRSYGQSVFVIDDPDGAVSGEYGTEIEATEAVERWNNSDASMLHINWKDAPENADDSHRGFYIFTLETAPKWRQVVACGWHSMEASMRLAKRLRDAIARYGAEAVGETIKAISEW